MATQAEIREQVTNRIVEALKAGTAPWRRPWSNLPNTGTPANAVSGKAYRGINVLLAGTAGYASRWWATYPQIQALGGRVRKGERATRIVYWRKVEVTAVKGGQEVVDSYPLLRTYCVFNLEQCEGPGVERFLARPCLGTPFVDYGPAETAIAATDARIEFGGHKAMYCPRDDFIRLPPKEAFESQQEYYSTAFHELAHWSGHESRLDRLQKNARFGSDNYAFEELVAEVGGCFLCNEVGIPQSAKLDNHAAYLASWLAVLQRDASAIFTAAGQASAAADFILAFSRTHAGVDGDQDEPAAVGVNE